ncbi:MAG: NYN domain-containing protein [Candidatus Pacebacteria bacterium]|nr:NYN domain-containing protein [Candidatus Paceibacterota bacterium]
MRNQENNFAYIDGNNLYKGITELGWKLDYKRFRIFLKDKYNVHKAYLFLGFISKNTQMYRDLQNWGYTIVFKPTIPDKNGEVKGNCDSELVLQTVIDFYENNYSQAIIISGDGDFACLAKFLTMKKKLKIVLAPQHKKCSVLLKQSTQKITFLAGLKNKLQFKQEIK